MGRLSDLFDHHRDNVEEGVKKALGRADDTLEALRKRLEQVEAKLREVAGESPVDVKQPEQATNEDQVVTARKTSNVRGRK